VKTVRSLFETIARSQYFNVTTGLFTQCMTWKEMKELAVNEEINWLGPRFLSISSKEQRHYDKHMQQRIDFWGDIANMRRHLKALYPDPTLQSFLANDPESDPTAPTGSKRGAQPTQTVAAKRAKPLTDAVSPPPPSPVQNDRRRGRDNGKYTPTRRPPACTNAFSEDEIAEVPSSKRRHDE
jgi:hypothetical protein